MTFSVVARDAVTGQLGGAVASKFLAVGGMVLHARADVGVVATQALANLSYGPRGLALLAAGVRPTQAVEALTSSDELPERRQVALVDATGRTAAHTGSGCMPWAGDVAGDGFSCQGNILVSRAVVDAMADVMRGRLDLRLAERLVAALAAGQAAGGDSRGQQSAGVVVVSRDGGYGGGSDRLVDLRVDDHATPLVELQRLVSLHSPVLRQAARGGHGGHRPRCSPRSWPSGSGRSRAAPSTRPTRSRSGSGSSAGRAGRTWRSGWSDPGRST